MIKQSFRRCLSLINKFSPSGAVFIPNHPIHFARMAHPDLAIDANPFIKRFKVADFYSN